MVKFPNRRNWHPVTGISLGGIFEIRWNLKSERLLIDLTYCLICFVFVVVFILLQLNMADIANQKETINGEYIDPSSSSVKSIARTMGISPKAVTLKGMLQYIQNMHRELRLQSYSTQYEVNIGKKLLENVGVFTADEEHPVVNTLKIPLVLTPVQSTECEQIIELPPNKNAGSDVKDEETNVKTVIFSHLVKLVHPIMTLLLTVDQGSFVDPKGREMHSDMVLMYVSSLREWPHVVTMFQGSDDLARDFELLLGQARRRAAAVLSAQPWRRFVIIVMYDLSHVAFFRLDQDGYNHFTEPMDFLCHTDGHKYSCRYGYHLLLDYLKHPQKLGFSMSSKLLMGFGGFKEIKPTLICGRSKGKAVFVVKIGDENVVVKVFANKEAAEHEHRLLQQVQLIKGTAQLHPCCVDEIVSCVGFFGKGDEEMWYGFATTPYCTVLAPSLAQPRHFAAVARTILAASSNGLVCNDISPDNLLFEEATDKVFIGDWGLATTPGTRIGTSGKWLYIPPSCRLECGSVDKERVASARSDLFALLLVAVCCALRDVPWACTKTDLEIKGRMLDACGLSKRPSGLCNEWAYLLDVASVVVDATQSDEQVVAAFASF